MAERVFALPDLGEGLEEGRIVEWLVREGDEVTLNQPLVEVETAKAAVEIPSPFTGTIVRLHGAVDDDVPVGSPLVTFEVEGAEPTPASVPGSATVIAYAPGVERHAAAGPARATPPVRKLAKELGVDIAVVRGSGPDGRVTEEDVRREVTRTASVGDHTETRRAIASTLERQAAIPHVTTFRTVDCTALDTLRREMGVSPLPIVIAAMCQTIDDHPLINARWVRDAVEHRAKVNVGIATDTEQGLMVPVLQDAGRRGIADITAEITRLAEAARGGGLTVDDLAATATIAVSNTGSYGSEAGTPILSPGTGVTLAFGVIAPRALVIDGDVVARPAATISLTFDHRVLDGAAAGRFLTDLVSLLQSPDRLRDLPR